MLIPRRGPLVAVEIMTGATEEAELSQTSQLDHDNNLYINC